MLLIYFIVFPELLNSAFGQLTCLEPPVNSGDPIGIEYTGNLSISDIGLCAMWLNASGNLNYLSPSQFPDTSIQNAKNYCRNPKSPLGTYEPRPWCWLQTNSESFGYCSIPLCTGICRSTYLGETFKGNVSTTISGRTCQNWSSQIPHSHIYNATNWPIQGETINQAENKCRNPNSSPYGLWCYTTDLTPVWEPCMAPVCKSINNCVNGTSNYLYKSQTPTEQFLQTCVPWSNISLQYDYQASMPTLVNTGITNSIFHPALLPDASFSEASNYCRNPDNDTVGAWCYVKNGASYSKKYCKTQCSGVWACLYDINGSYYQGIVNVTETNQTCANWSLKGSYYIDSNFPENSIVNAQNYCRNPTNSPGGPWCWLLSNPNRFGFCTIPICQQTPPLTPLTTTAGNPTCKSTDSGLEYTGNISITINQNTCAPWNTTSFYNPYFNRPILFQTSTIFELFNYCRNPSNDSLGPWCYTISGVQEYCLIPKCNISVTSTSILKKNAANQCELITTILICHIIFAYLLKNINHFYFP